MSKKPSAWFHSWYVDTLCLHSIPLIFTFLAVFNLPPFRQESYGVLIAMVTWIIVIDWGHIFAQWFRIYSNPVESKKLKWLYPLSYLALIPLLTVLVKFSGRVPVETFLIYYVIYHFIKQHYGFTRIYSKIDGQKTKLETRIEDIAIYASMVTPVLYWHLTFPYKHFLWKTHFLKSNLIEYLFYLSAAIYIVSFVLYGFNEIKRSLRNGYVNWAKNLAFFSAALGWGVVSLLSDSVLLIFFTVVLTHDVSYTCFVWLIGRRDQQKIQKKIPWRSWFSVPGFIIYVVVLVIVSQVILVIHHRLVGHHVPNVVYGNLFAGIPYIAGWVESFGIALFFATQGHHYFIDKYLWKKEKDLEYMVKTGKYSLS